MPSSSMPLQVALWHDGARKRPASARRGGRSRRHQQAQAAALAGGRAPPEAHPPGRPADLRRPRRAAGRDAHRSPPEKTEAVESAVMDEIVLDLTDPENDDWIKVSRAGLEDLALSLPPGTDLLAYLRERPDMPLARAVLSGEL